MQVRPAGCRPRDLQGQFRRPGHFVCPSPFCPAVSQPELLMEAGHSIAGPRLTGVVPVTVR